MGHHHAISCQVLNMPPRMPINTKVRMHNLSYGLKSQGEKKPYQVIVLKLAATETPGGGFELSDCAHDDAPRGGGRGAQV
jgi:hypothetical protein